MPPVFSKELLSGPLKRHSSGRDTAAVEPVGPAEAGGARRGTGAEQSEVPVSFTHVRKGDALCRPGSDPSLGGRYCAEWVTGGRHPVAVAGTSPHSVRVERAHPRGKTVG